MMVWKIIYKKKEFFLFVFFFCLFHIQEILSHSRESGSISRRLPDDPGGFTYTQERNQTFIRFDIVYKYIQTICFALSHSPGDKILSQVSSLYHTGTLQFYSFNSVKMFSAATPGGVTTTCCHKIEHSLIFYDDHSPASFFSTWGLFKHTQF